jgi:site-specific recombinase XerD
VQALLKTCDSSPIGIRDRALIRVLWSTGIRRMSAISMRIEKLEPVPEGYLTPVKAKHDKIVTILICGRAATALEAWIDILQGGGFKDGPIWRKFDGTPMTPRLIWWMLNNRSLEAKVRRVSPHMLRAAFLTFNKASLEAKQEAVGHADVNTTRSYDRSQWRGKEAFMAMPEIEDLAQ